MTNEELRVVASNILRCLNDGYVTNSPNRQIETLASAVLALLDQVEEMRSELAQSHEEMDVYRRAANLLE